MVYFLTDQLINSRKHVSCIIMWVSSWQLIWWSVNHSLFWVVMFVVAATNTPGDTAKHMTLHTPSYLISVCISERQNMLANLTCVLQTCKSCPIIEELGIFIMEGIWRYGAMQFRKTPFRYKVYIRACIILRHMLEVNYMCDTYVAFWCITQVTYTPLLYG